MTADVEATPESEPEFDEETVEGAEIAYVEICGDSLMPMTAWVELSPEMRRALCHAWASGYDAALDTVENESGEAVNGE